VEVAGAESRKEEARVAVRAMATAGAARSKLTAVATGTNVATARAEAAKVAADLATAIVVGATA